jgi:hypothetical protein
VPAVESERDTGAGGREREKQGKKKRNGQIKIKKRKGKLKSINISGASFRLWSVLGTLLKCFKLNFVSKNNLIFSQKLQKP